MGRNAIISTDTNGVVVAMYLPRMTIREVEKREFL